MRGQLVLLLSTYEVLLKLTFDLCIYVLKEGLLVEVVVEVVLQLVLRVQPRSLNVLLVPVRLWLREVVERTNLVGL